MALFPTPLHSARPMQSWRSTCRTHLLSAELACSPDEPSSIEANMSEAKQPAVTLYDSAVPPLTAGEYTVQVKQKVKYWDWEKTDGQLKKLQKESPFDKSFKFQVSGPRFSLSPAEIYERYPAADAKGAFSETFPHIVLSRRTLPWERRLKG